MAESGRLGEDVKLQGLLSWGEDCASMIGIIGRETLLETRESLRKFGSNFVVVPLFGESGQWGWQGWKESMEGEQDENSDLAKLKEGEGEESLEHNEGGGGVGAGRWVAILSNLPTLSSGGLST